MSDLTRKLALGTVQFGLDYGITNDRGQVPASEVTEILTLAAEAGVSTLDTAHAYGNSESVLGSCLPNVSGGNFHIVSKFPPGADRPPMADVLAESLDRLHQDSLYGYLFHSLDTYTQAPERWQEMLALKAEARVAKIGFSLYQPADALALLEAGLEIDLVQVPLSVLDQRWLAAFGRLKAAGVEIHVRSAFLQGLVFRDPATLDAHFASAKASLARLRALSAETGLSVAGLCLGFALAQDEIDKVVIGVADVGQFRENLDLVRRMAELDTALVEEMKKLAIVDEQVLLPMFWPG